MHQYTSEKILPGSKGMKMKLSFLPSSCVTTNVALQETVPKLLCLSKVCLLIKQITIELWLHYGTFTNPGISNSTFVAPWLGLDLYDLFNESISYRKALERIVFIMLPWNS